MQKEILKMIYMQYAFMKAFNKKLKFQIKKIELYLFQIHITKIAKMASTKVAPLDR